MSLEGVELGRYRIIRIVRKGGMGEIYLAEDTRISRQVAVKIMQYGAIAADEAAVQEALRLFRREMGIVANLYHPHILQLYDSGEEIVNNTPVIYMVMPFHGEGSLRDWLRQRGKSELLSTEDVAGLISQAADALQCAHDQQIVHLDIKPSNFLVQTRKERPEQPDLFLADFGIASMLTTSKESVAMRGTLAYMAPEQWEGRPVAASDQYALAIMAYQLLTGKVPFHGNLSQIMLKHLREIPQPPSKLNPHVSSAVDAVILQGLAKKPEERFASVSEFAQALQQAEEANRDGTENTFQLPGRRRPADRWESAEPTVSLKEEEKRPIHLQSTVYVVSPNEGEKLPVSGWWRRWLRYLGLVLAAICLVIASIIGFGAYQNHVQQFNAAATATATIANSTAMANATATAMIANSTAMANATATVVAGATATVVAANPYPSYFSGKGTLALYDPLSAPGEWPDESDTSFGGACNFTGGVYHVSETETDKDYVCDGTTTYSDFAAQIQMTVLKGDCGGMDFRGDGTNAKEYEFVVCQDGSYYLNLYTSNTNASSLLTGLSSQIKKGVNQANTMAVVAKGPVIGLYVNNQEVASANNSAYSSGIISLNANAITNATEVVYSNAKVWAF